MVGEIDWRILNPNNPALIAGSFEQGRQNRLASIAAGRAYELASMQMDEARQAASDKRTLRDIYAQTGGDVRQAIPKLYQAGLGSQAADMAEAHRKQQAAKLQQAKQGAELMTQMSARVSVNPLEDVAIAVLGEWQDATGADITNEVNKVRSFGGDQVKIKQWADGFGLMAKDLLGKIGNVDLGGSVQHTITDPRTGKVTVTGETPKTLTPLQAIEQSPEGREHKLLERAAGAVKVVMPNPVKDAGGVTKLYKDIQETYALPLKRIDSFDMAIGALSKSLSGKSSPQDWEATKKIFMDAIGDGQTSRIELQRAGSDPQVVSSLFDTISKLTTGSPTDATKRNLLSTLIGLRNTIAGQIKGRLDEQKDIATKYEGLDPRAANDIFNTKRFAPVTDVSRIPKSIQGMISADVWAKIPAAERAQIIKNEGE